MEERFDGSIASKDREKKGEGRRRRGEEKGASKDRDRAKDASNGYEAKGKQRRCGTRSGNTSSEAGTSQGLSLSNLDIRSLV